MIIEESIVSGKWFIAKYKECLKCPKCMKRLKKIDKKNYKCTNDNCNESNFEWNVDSDNLGGHLIRNRMKLIENTSTKNSKTHIKDIGRIALCGTELHVLCCNEIEGDIFQVTCKKCIKAYKESEEE